MNTTKQGLLLGAFLLGALTLKAQTADEILSKHIEAIGGKQKLSAITSLRTESTLEIMGNEAPSVATVLNGKGMRTESEFQGSKIIQVVTDKGGWMINPMMGAAEPQAMPDEQYKASREQIYVMPFLDYAARGSKAELAGQEKVGEVNAYKIRMTDADNNVTTFYFDPNTYYMVQMVKTGDMMGQQVDLRTVFSDHKKTDYGLVYPASIEINFGDQFSMTSRINKVEVNAPVDVSIFEMKK